MTGRNKLQTLLELREHTLSEAEQTLALALASSAQHQAAQQALDERVNGLLERLVRHKQSRATTQKAADLQANARFETRLQAELKEAEQVARAHRAGPLVESERKLSQAQAAHVQAKQDLKLVNRHRESALADALRQDERRGEGEVDDWLRAQRLS